MKTKQWKAEKLKKIEPGRSRTFQTSKTTPHPQGLQGDRFLCYMEILLLLRSLVSESVSSWMQALWSSLGLSQFLAHRSFTRASCFSRSPRFCPLPLASLQSRAVAPGLSYHFSPRNPKTVQVSLLSGVPRLESTPASGPESWSMYCKNYIKRLNIQFHYET